MSLLNGQISKFMSPRVGMDGVPVAGMSIAHVGEHPSYHEAAGNKARKGANGMCLAHSPVAGAKLYTTAAGFYYANERAVNWEGYDGNPANMLFPKKGDVIWLSWVRTDVRIDHLEVFRSAAGGGPYDIRGIDNGFAPKTGADAEAINDMYMPQGVPAAEFPAFDLYLCDMNRDRSIKLLDKAATPAGGGIGAGLEAETRLAAGTNMWSCEDLAVLMVLDGDILPNSFMTLTGYGLHK